jgi:hypothetical protein
MSEQNQRAFVEHSLDSKEVPTGGNLYSTGASRWTDCRCLRSRKEPRPTHLTPV